MTELQYRMIRAVTECITIANETLNTHHPVPDVRFDIRGKTAGMALLQRWQLRFNPILLKENPEAFLREVVPHEVAHLLVYAAFGKVRPHGKEWQAMMQQVFKVPAKTTHTFDISSVSGKHFIYRCQCDEIPLTIRRHNKVQRQQTQYFCRRCQHPLTWTGSCTS
ncbi:SprT family zinc-dependent metalloprotease [Veronia pacifica]|uniref:Protein SprT n=1 Tax=Veronia pacifica TaxID=1080227 RepID=A0A1C3EIZ3_9GAMM|nr:SprT family zinc-dependent metalloprotease [Veronia pacifica]ODA33198.1 SprT family protein [Veronia pacifica]